MSPEQDNFSRLERLRYARDEDGQILASQWGVPGEPGSIWVEVKSRESDILPPGAHPIRPEEQEWLSEPGKEEPN